VIVATGIPRTEGPCPSLTSKRALPAYISWKRNLIALPSTKKAGGAATIVDADANAITFSRTTTQLLKIVYGGGSVGGAFFPNGLNGAINQGRQKETDIGRRNDSLAYVGWASYRWITVRIALIAVPWVARHVLMQRGESNLRVLNLEGMCACVPHLFVRNLGPCNTMFPCRCNR
jgi:hypothetical protein